MPLPEASTIKSLGIPALTGDDDRVDLLIAAGDAVLAQLCLFPRPVTGHHTLENASYLQYYSRVDQHDSRRLTLGLRPVAISELAYDIDGALSYTSVANLASDVVVDDQRGIVFLHPTGTWVWGSALRAIRVTATAGYDVGEEPALVQALALLVAHWIAVGQVGPLLQSATVGGSSAALRDLGIPAAVRALINPYVLWERETHFRGQP